MDRSLMQAMVLSLSLFIILMVFIGFKQFHEEEKEESLSNEGMRLTRATQVSSFLSEEMNKITSVIDRSTRRMDKVMNQFESQIISMDRRLSSMDERIEKMGSIRTTEPRTNNNNDDDMNRKSSTLQEETARLLLETVRKDVSCSDERRWGGGKEKGEGAWTVCMDGMKGNSRCVIYSFGINNDFSFDDESQMETGCEIHSFDPSMGWNNMKRREGSWFWNIGISGEDSERDHRGWKLQTLSTTMRSLNHSRIDILKMDVEGDEWDTLENMMEDGSLSFVDRLMIETHFYSSSPKSIELHERWRRILQMLRRNGMMLHYFRENPMSTSSETGFRNIMSCCFELSFMRKGS